MKRKIDRWEQRRKRLERIIKETSPTGWGSRGEENKEFRAYLFNSMKKYNERYNFLRK